MDDMSGERAVKILEWVYWNLTQMEPEDLTTFEQQLLERISKKDGE